MWRFPKMSEDDERARRRAELDAKVPIVDLRNGAKGIATWAQTIGEDLHPAALEILGEARRISSKIDDQTVTSIVIGKNAEKHADTLISHGADKVYVISDDRLEYYRDLPYARAVTEAIKEINPEIMIYTATALGRSLAPRCASRLHVGLSADCTQLDVGQYISRKQNQRFPTAFLMIRPSFGESKLATIIGPWTYPQSATVRPGVFRPLEPDTTRKGEVILFTPNFTDEDWKTEVLSFENEADRLELDKADIIISGGKGIGKDGFVMLQELVDAIRENGQKVELGSSRAAVNAGYISHDHQIGQTGKTVHPKLYVAVGISGAIQHLMGMQSSRKVIAINTDPNARIFSVADYGIVDDYKNVIPPLIEKVKSGFKFNFENV